MKINKYNYLKIMKNKIIITNLTLQFNIIKNNKINKRQNQSKI